MAKLVSKGSVRGEIWIGLSEEEAAALDALVGYGVDEFLKVFYRHMGEAYLRPYEKGLRSLFESVRTGDASVSLFLKRYREARAVMNGDAKIVGQVFGG